MRCDVASFHQVDAYLASQKRVLEVSRVVDAGSQQHDVRIASIVGGQGPQRGKQRLLGSNSGSISARYPNLTKANREC